MKPLSCRYLILLLVLVLAGCGGGGGGGGGTIRFSYTTDWSLAGTPGLPTGQGQRITLTPLAGGTARSITLARAGSGRQTVELDSVRIGRYALRVQLYPTADLTTSPTGEIQQVIDLGGVSSFSSRVGGAAASLLVTPGSATLSEGEAANFYVSPLTASGEPTFYAPGDMSWSVLGSGGTIDPSTGVFNAGVPGTTNLRVRQTSTGLLGTSSVTISPFVATRSKWTVIVYMNAANDLSPWDDDNINQMERVANRAENVRFVVQWKQAFDPDWDPFPNFIGTRRYLVKPDTGSAIASQLLQDMGEGVDMGRPETMAAFIDWAKARYPADRYCLVVWNHGNGWRDSLRSAAAPVTRGVSYDDETGSYIRTRQLNAALGAGNLDIISWDASLMQMMEVAYEIKSRAPFIVGSEESPPGEGLPYDRIFAAFRDNPGSSTRQLTKSFVDGMLAVPAYTSRKITQSSVETARLPALRNAIDQLADALIANRDAVAPIISTFRTQGKGFSVAASLSRYYYDLNDLCAFLEANTAIPAVITATDAVQSALSNAVAWNGFNLTSQRILLGYDGSSNPIYRLSDIGGLSIDLAPGSVVTSGDYSVEAPTLLFNQESRWDDWLRVAP